MRDLAWSVYIVNDESEFVLMSEGYELAHAIGRAIYDAMDLPLSATLVVQRSTEAPPIARSYAERHHLQSFTERARATIARRQVAQ